MTAVISNHIFVKLLNFFLTKPEMIVNGNKCVVKLKKKIIQIEHTVLHYNVNVHSSKKPLR